MPPKVRPNTHRHTMAAHTSGSCMRMLHHDHSNNEAELESLITDVRISHTLFTTIQPKSSMPALCLQISEYTQPPLAWDRKQFYLHTHLTLQEQHSRERCQGCLWKSGLVQRSAAQGTLTAEARIIWSPMGYGGRPLLTMARYGHRQPAGRGGRPGLGRPAKGAHLPAPSPLDSTHSW